MRIFLNPFTLWHKRNPKESSYLSMNLWELLKEVCEGIEVEDDSGSDGDSNEDESLPDTHDAVPTASRNVSTRKRSYTSSRGTSNWIPSSSQTTRSPRRNSFRAGNSTWINSRTTQSSSPSMTSSQSGVLKCASYPPGTTAPVTTPNTTNSPQPSSSVISMTPQLPPQ